MNTKGFSLIESMVAIAVLTISMTAATSVVQSSLQNATKVKAKGQAIGLAVEGIEYVRNYHDTKIQSSTDYKAGNQFYNFVNNCGIGCSFDANYEYDSGVVVNLVLYDACNDTCKPLNLSDKGYLRNLWGGDTTVYTRKVRIIDEEIKGGVSLKIFSEVEYEIKGERDSVVIETYQFIPTLVSSGN